MKTPKREESEGEEVIRIYLEAEGIDFEQEVEIKDLKGDNKQLRKADFYLPQYKVYIEFFGKWNFSESEKERYREKKNIYYENNIPCIYLYPENLGILDFVFKRRLKKELLKHPELKWPLFKLNWNLFTESFGLLGIILVILSIYVENNYWRAGFIVVTLLHIYNSFRESVGKWKN